MVGDERAPSFIDKFMIKSRQDPLVPIGALATVGFLVSGDLDFSDLKFVLSANRHVLLSVLPFPQETSPARMNTRALPRVHGGVLNTTPY